MPHASVAGRKVYYEVHGDHDGVPLVLVMGLGGSYRGWLPLQVPEFSEARRTIVFDNRGVGKSEEAPPSFSTADMADDTAGLLDALEIERADLLGAFMGGMIAQEMALRHSERVRRIVLVGTYARPDAKRRMLLEGWAEMARTGAPLDVRIRERLLWTLQEETLEQVDLIEDMIRFFTRDGAPLSDQVFVEQCRACVEHDTHDRLREIERPTLVVCGRYDLLTPPKFHRELADEIPGARLVTLSYGAHLVMVESAQRFNALVLQFLAEAND
jgi:pimeloyl-ACP methyl ester carboxylesterase